MSVNCNLSDLLVAIDGQSDAEVEAVGRGLYTSLYLNRGDFGLHQTHDGQVLIYFARAFDHAFFTTSDRRCHPERKDRLRRGSIERIRWIGEIVSGRVPGSACFEVPSPTGRERPPNRFYAIYTSPFVVWLEPRSKGGWKFSSAYPLSIEEIHKYSRGGRTAWKWKEKSSVIDRLTEPEALSKPVKA